MRTRTTASIDQTLLKDLLVALVSAFSGVLTCFYGTRYWHYHDLYFFNYREAGLLEGWIFLWVGVGVAFGGLGIYGSAWILRQFYPRRMSVFEPALLAVGGTIGGVLGLFAHAPIATSSDFWSLTAWIGLGIGSFIGVYLAGFIKLPRLMGRRDVLIRTSIVPITLIVFLCLLNYYPGFPGADATAQVRQQWASKTFNDYGYMIGDLKRCEPIVEKIGNVNFVAPTIGRNVSYLDGGSGYHGEFTLEVVGTSGSGVAHFPMHMGSIVHRDLSFTHEGATEKLICRP